MTKYDIFKYSVEISYKDRFQIVPGCSLNDPDSEKIAEFDTLEETREWLKKHPTEIYKFSGTIGSLYNVTEYFVQKNEYDENGEVEEYGDFWDESEMNIYIEDEDHNVVKTAHSYREAHEYVINDERMLDINLF